MFGENLTSSALIWPSNLAKCVDDTFQSIMAQAGSSCRPMVCLTTKNFPPEFENVFRARSQSPKQNTAAEKVMITGNDRRERVMHDSGEYMYSGSAGIGLLRMEFNGAPFTGTATMIAGGNCLLTCAHNVVDYDVLTKEFVYATNGWFDLRNNKAGSGSTLIKRYQVTKVAVYPQYFKEPTSHSGFDLALCWIHVPKDDHTIKGLCPKHRMPIPLAKLYVARRVAMVGFPGEHKGEKWGMVGVIPSEKSDDWSLPKDEEQEILVYDFIDTSPGQSGSPVMDSDGSYSFVLGVHTGGSDSRKKNWATYLTQAKLEWIAENVGSPWKVMRDYNTLYLHY